MFITVHVNCKSREHAVVMLQRIVVVGFTLVQNLVIINEKRIFALTLSILRELRGGQAFFRVIISFESEPPEVAPYMTRTFGEVFGPRNQTGSEPRPARK